jgi:hypothetical protein
VNAPDPNEPGPYGIGSDHWPGLGKALEEIADVRAALDFFEQANPVLTDEEHTTLAMSGRQFIDARYQWKLALFWSWMRNDPPEIWPQPEDYGLPPRDEQ